jgi:hypothetical protein
MVNSDIHIYTDASKTQNDTVGVGIHIRDVASNKTKDFSYRLNNSMQWRRQDFASGGARKLILILS